MGSAADPGRDTAPVTWRIHREIVLLLGWGRAILLQLASPQVACGVAEHSAFRTEGWGRWRRLHRTLAAMLTMTFGTAREIEAVVRRINAIHDRVHGRLDVTAGRLPAGTPYSAHDPALLGWVHATLIDSFVRTYELFVAPVPPGDRDRYCEETSSLETLLGLPPGAFPRRWDDLQDYMAATLEGGAIVVTDTARQLASDVLTPPVPWGGGPLISPIRWPTIGLLPPAIRDAYGLSWDARAERRLRRMAAVVRAVLPCVPRVLRHWRIARRAERRHRRATGAAPMGRS